MQTSVSNGTGQCNFSGQRDRSSFIVLGQRDNGTNSKSWHGTGRPRQPIKNRTGRGTGQSLFLCQNLIPSRPASHPKFWQVVPAHPVPLQDFELVPLSRCPFVPGQWKNFCPFVPKKCTVLSCWKPSYLLGCAACFETKVIFESDLFQGWTCPSTLVPDMTQGWSCIY